MLRSGRERAKRIAIWIGAVTVIAVILWLDVMTGLWNELVILSGLAAGLVTFLLTVLVLDKLIARSTARRWSPVNRLALTEFLYSIADDERSEISRGEIVPRARRDSRSRGRDELRLACRTREADAALQRIDGQARGRAAGADPRRGTDCARCALTRSARGPSGHPSRSGSVVDRASCAIASCAPPRSR